MHRFVNSRNYKVGLISKPYVIRIFDDSYAIELLKDFSSIPEERSATVTEVLDAIEVERKDIEKKIAELRTRDNKLHTLFCIVNGSPVNLPD